MQIPEPGYAGTNAELEQEHADFDWIDYWDECEYIDDEYWDSGPIGAKRKRGQYVPQLPLAKKRKLIMENLENVKFVGMGTRLERFYQLPPALGNVKPFALLPDWREKFANDAGVFVEKAMPEAMKKAAEAQDEDTPPKERHFNALVDGPEDEEWEDEEEEAEEGDDQDGDLGAQMAALDPEALKAVLKQRLGDAGLGDMDEGAMMAALAKMLSGDEEALGELTNTLLGQATQGNDSAVSGWLSQQGVNLEEGGEDDASSVATSELPGNTSKASKSSFDVSPTDSAIEIAKQAGGAKEMAMHGTSPLASAKKRAAPDDLSEDSAVKRRKAAQDSPPMKQPARLSNLESDDESDDDVAGAEMETPATNEESHESQPTEQAETSKPSTTTAAAKSANAKAVKNNTSVSAKSTGAKNYAKPTAAAAAKQTRKRKAEDEADEIENAAPTTKSGRPARKAARPDPAPPAPDVEPPARRTRSARAKAGK